MPYRFVTEVDADTVQVEEAFSQLGVSARRPFLTPIHRLLQAPYAKFSYTVAAADLAPSLLPYPDLSDAEVDRVISVTRDVLG